MSTTPANLASRPWRRSLRFSVRGMIVVVLVIGIWLGWLVRGARIQRDAVAAIEGAGGRVKYDFEWTDGNTLTAGEYPTPAWPANLIGVDCFGHVTDVWLYSRPMATDGAMAQIGRLTRIQRLHLSLVRFDDAELTHLKGLSELSLLYLNDTQVTDAGLGHVKGLSNLVELLLDGTRITDAGLVHLKGLTRLQVAASRRDEDQRRWACTLERSDQTLPARPQPHPGYRRRTGTSREAKQPFRPRPQRHPGYRRRAGTP